MTAKELFPEYIKLFILVMESEGQKNGNDVYKRTEKILDEDKDLIDKVIEEEMPFEFFVTMLMSRLIIYIHGLEKLSKMNREDIKILVDSMFDLYLKKPTRNFTSRYGLPPINELNLYHFEIKFFKKKE